MGQEQDRFRDLTLKQYEEVWNKENYDYAGETVHADFNDHPPTRFFDVGRTGPEALIEAAQEFHAASRSSTTRPSSCSSRATGSPTSGRSPARRRASSSASRRPGRRMRVWGVNFFRMEDDKIIERWGQFDVLTMMQQLGLAPGPPVPEAPEEGPEYGDPRRAGREDSSNIAANKAVYERMVERGRQPGEVRGRRRALPPRLRRPRRPARDDAGTRRASRRSSTCSGRASRT